MAMLVSSNKHMEAGATRVRYQPPRGAPQVKSLIYYVSVMPVRFRTTSAIMRVSVLGKSNPHLTLRPMAHQWPTLSSFGNARVLYSHYPAPLGTAQGVASKEVQ